MPCQVCGKCSRANPDDASYCYYDGVRLAGTGDGPIDAGRQNFPIPFTFPSGMVCRNFDQFATACQDNWQATLNLLKEGMLSSFFGGIGRADLAMAAQEAARFPDRDRGLDQLLDKLPTQALPRPQLAVEPTEINLGQVPIGTDRTIQVRLTNKGARLLYGSIASDVKWLTLGDGPGSSQKLFQFGAEATIPVQIRGQHLRAGTKPLEGQLVIESNGGSATVIVRVSVPIKPFTQGCLAGSQTPRQVAEKARAHPKEAAPLFESGAVGDWFRSNGWIYPVQGPSANGIGSVQQFFEALGLAKAPKVHINLNSLALHGAPGQSLQAQLEVSTQEKKPVYAHATCEQPWVDVSRVKLAGRLATITVAVPSVPNRSGETLQTKISVAGNGNQRFTVPLSLAISGAPVVGGANPFADLSNAVVAGAPTGGGSGSGIRPGPAPVSSGGFRPPLADATPTPTIDRPAAQRKSAWVHLTPLLLLCLAMLVLPLRDWLATPPAPDIDSSLVASGVQVEPRPRLAILFDASQLKPGDREPPIRNDNMNFGLWSLDLTDPRNPKFKKLIYGDRGHTSNTLLRIDDADETFGKPGTGQWVLKEPKLKNWEHITPPIQKEGVGAWSTKGIVVTQTVKIVPGEPTETEPNVYKSYYDTCLVTYKFENADTKVHVVGMRVLLDTLIGSNDGVPFTIPGQSTLITKKEFKDEAGKKKEVPDFIMALEYPDIAKPGTVVQLTLHLSEKLEAPSRVLLTMWPGALKNDDKSRREALEKWEVPLKDIDEDSSIVMYWSPEKLKPGESREIGYSYGLASLAATKEGQLAVSVGGNFTKEGELSVVALVNNARPGEKVTIELPPELKLLPETPAEQPVLAPEGNRPRPTTWRVRSTVDGAFTVTVRTGSGIVQKKRIVIRALPIY